MRSIRIKLLVLIWTAVFGVYVLLAVAAGYHILRVIDSDVAQTMNQITDRKAGELNQYFLSVQRTVDTLEDNIAGSMDLELFFEIHCIENCFSLCCSLILDLMYLRNVSL